MAEETSLFSPANKKALTDPLIDNNPVTIQVLGICSSLAVTTQLKPSLVMGIAVMAVIAGANVVISLIRHFIPIRVRIIVEMVVVATLVIMVDELLQAYAFEVSKQLSVFVGLIITNCIVMGRLEAFAMGNPPLPSLLDGLGNGIGYAGVLLIVGFFRELLGAGTLFGMRVIPEAAYAHGFVNNGFMLLAPGAFIILGLIVWFQRTVSGYTED